jgi:hypothetical protein
MCRSFDMYPAVYPLKPCKSETLTNITKGFEE